MSLVYKFENAEVQLGTSVSGGIGALSAAVGSAGAGTVMFSNSNGVSFGINAGTLTASVAAGGGGGIAASAGTQSVSTGTVAWSNSNNVSFGMSGSNVITASASFPAETPFGISAGTQSVSTGTMVLSNSNGITFGMSGSSRITASHNGITSQTNQQMTMFATGNTTQASTGTSNASSLIFRGEGIASVGLSNGSVVVSVPTGAPSPVNFSAGAASADLGSVVFSNANGISFGLNGSTITAGGAIESQFEPYSDRLLVNGQVGNGTLQINPIRVPGAVQFDRIGLAIYNTNSSNSSGSHTMNFWAGIYTKNASTLSLLASASQSTAITHSGTAGSYSLWSGGPRLFTIGMTTTLQDGDYWLGLVSQTSTAGTNGTYSQFLVSAMASNFLGHFGSSHNTTYQMAPGRGVYTVTTAGMPSSVAFSQIRGSDSAAMRPPWAVFISGTV